MSTIIRPTVVCAIIFGCLAAIIPRIIIPMLRSKSAATRDHDQHQRPAQPISTESSTFVDDLISKPEFDETSKLSKNDFYNRLLKKNQKSPISPYQNPAKQMPMFGIPMYAVGIIVFLLYTCFRYFSTANKREKRIQQRYSSKNILWNPDKHRFKYDANARLIMDEEDEADDEYAGLDPDYVEYLKSKRQKELEAERQATVEQRQMSSTLDSMKNSLSFISTKLANKGTGGALSEVEISQLQDRLAATEAQMYKIITALDAASTKVQQLSKATRPTTENGSVQNTDYDVDELPGVSRSSVDSESFSDDENSESDEDDDDESLNHQEKPADDNAEDESSSSYEEDNESLSEGAEEDHDDESEASSARYGLMETNYDCNLNTVEDYDLDPTVTINNPPQDSLEKVEEWRQRHHSATTEDQIAAETLPDAEEKSQ